MKLSQMPIMQKFKFNKKNILIIAAMALIIALLFAVSKEPRNITYSQYMQLMDGNFIDKAVIDEDEVILYAQNNRFAIIKEGIDIKELIKNKEYDKLMPKRVFEKETRNIKVTPIVDIPKGVLMGLPHKDFLF